MRLLWQYVARGAQAHPARPAVEYDGRVLSYGALDEMSDRLAWFLAAAGIGPGDRVGLYAPRSERSLVVLHAILKAGAAYVPVDPNAPIERAAYILDDCAVRGLFVSERKLGPLSRRLAGKDLRSIVVMEGEARAGSIPELADSQIIGWETCMEEVCTGPPPAAVGPEVGPDEPAYLLYTSGSTGAPKGVVLTHRNAISFVEWAHRTFAVQPDDRLSNHAPLHFDLSVFDLYVALRSGACVVMVPDRLAPFPGALAAWIDTAAISVWYSVPSVLTRLLLQGELERFEYRRLRALLFAGEVFPVRYLRGVMSSFRHARFYNLYGPTETNVCTWYPLPESLPEDEPTDVPIGRACSGTRVWALREDGGVVAPGESGELWVEGPTVMLGYWGEPGLRDSAAFDEGRSEPRERVYRTGDIVRMEPEGNYTFLGRKDLLVKSRGYRIGLGEIETVLQQHDRVREAVVSALADGEIGSRLVALVAPTCQDAVSREELAALCRKALPGYMVPEDYIFCAAVPRTSTGKIDRTATTTLLGGEEGKP